jgi:hypothetical protein
MSTAYSLTHIRTQNEGDIFTMLPSTRGASHNGSKLWLQDDSCMVLSSAEAEDDDWCSNSGYCAMSMEHVTDHFMDHYIASLEANIARRPNQQCVSSHHGSPPTETPAPAFGDGSLL